MRKDLTAGKPLHLILTFAIPMLMGMLFQQFSPSTFWSSAFAWDYVMAFPFRWPSRWAPMI